MGTEAHELPPADELVELVIEAGSYIKAAERLGIPDSTLKGYIARAGKRDELNARRKRKVAVVAPEPEPKPVDDPLRIKLEQQAGELRLLRAENREYAKKLASQEEFFERIVEASQVPAQAPKYRAAKPKKKLPSRSVVVPVYDQQFGQLVRPDDTPGGRGKFDTSVFDTRLERWLEGVTGNIRDYAQSHRIEELIIPLGGDQVEGDEIFPGQSWQLELDPARQVWELAGKSELAFRELIRFAKEEVGIPWVAFYAVPGNHGKVGGKRSGARPSTYNWDWLYQMILRDKLRKEPINEFIIEPAGAIFFYAAGVEFQAIHGEQIKGWGGIPFYGIARHDAKSVRLHNRIFRYLLMGHIHQPAELTTGSGAEAIVSGDWVGANNMSGFITAASRPQQRVIYVAHKWGVTESARIYLTDAETAWEPTPIHGVPALAA